MDTANAKGCGLGSGGADGRPNLTLDEGESAALSPSSPRYQPFYREHRPTRLAELQELIGVRVSADDQRLGGRCGCSDELAATVLMPEHLQVEDPAQRTRADRMVYQATRDYLAGHAAQLKAWEPAIEAWIALKKPILWVAYLNDIVVADRATLTLSANTHALYARTITIHGSGRINCHGPVKIKAVSLEGKRFSLSQIVQLAPNLTQIAKP